MAGNYGKWRKWTDSSKRAVIVMCTIQATSKIVHAEIIQTFATAKQRATNYKTSTPPMTPLQSNTTSTHGHDDTEDERFAKHIYKIYRPQDAKVIWSTPRYETSHMPNQPFADPRQSGVKYKMNVDRSGMCVKFCANDLGMLLGSIGAP